MRIIIICSILAFAAYGCEKNKLVQNVDHSTKYQPLALGHTWIYEVDSIHFYGNGSQKPDTFQFLQRNIVASSFINEQGEESFKVTRSVKKDSISDWVFQKNYSLTKTSISLNQTFDDEATIELTFPFVLLKDWDCNQYNNQNEAECYFEEIHTAKIIGSKSYDSTSTVLQDKERNAINSFFSKNTYAANIGLVSKNIEAINQIENDPKGVKLTLTLISFER